MMRMAEICRVLKFLSNGPFVVQSLLIRKNQRKGMLTNFHKIASKDPPCPGMLDKRRGFF